MRHPQEILHEEQVQAMVAADSFAPLAERITTMLRAGRRMAMAEHFGIRPHRRPLVYAGLQLDHTAFGGAIRQRITDRSMSFEVSLTTGGVGVEDRQWFGFSADIYEYSGNTTEAAAWARYHQGKQSAERFDERRRNMTLVEIVGGLPGQRYRVGDSITVSHWNNDGFCTEKTLGFELASGSWAPAGQDQP